MKKALLFVLFSTTLVSCGGSGEQPKVDYNDNKLTDTLTIENMVADTSKILMAELPFYFDSTEILLSPIGFVDLEALNRKSESGIKKSISASSYGYSDDYSSAKIASLSSDNISGNITNVVFENFKTKEQRLLTKKALSISNIQYLRELAKKINKHYLIYHVYDRDTNKDGKLNHKDIQTLYVSNLDGSNFTKAIPEGQEYESGRLIVLTSTFYFRTIEDTNKDGYFDKNDKHYLYAIDFSGDTFLIKEYNPLALLSK